MYRFLIIMNFNNNLFCCLGHLCFEATVYCSKIHVCGFYSFEGGLETWLGKRPVLLEQPELLL